MDQAAFLAARLRRRFVAMSAALAACSVLLFAAFPERRGFFLEEDRGVENLTVALFVVAAAVGLLVTRIRGWFRGLTVLPIIVLGILGALDELSFGERIVGFEPISVGRYRIDGLHDILTMAFNILTDDIERPYAIALVAAATAAVAAGAYRLRRELTDLIGRLWVFPCNRYLALSLALLALAAGLDLELYSHEWLAFFEETLELLAALALVFGARAGQLPPLAPARTPAIVVDSSARAHRPS